MPPITGKLKEVPLSSDQLIGLIRLLDSTQSTAVDYKVRRVKLLIQLGEAVLNNAPVIAPHPTQPQVNGSHHEVEEQQQPSDGGYSWARRKKPRNGLTPMQLKAIRVLATSKSPMTMLHLSNQSSVTHAWLTYSLYGGRIKDAPDGDVTEVTPQGAEGEQKLGYKSLLGLGYVKGILIDIEGRKERLWQITPKGISYLSTLS